MPTETISAPPPVRRRSGTSRTQWLVPIGLMALALIPILGGAFRLTELTGGAEITPQNERFFDSPIPVVIHIVSVTVYSLLGAFQFVPALRGRRAWHRMAGRILVPAGLLVALSGLWMTLFYALPPQDGVLVFIFRLVFGTAMLVSIILAIPALRRRNFAQHGAWMTRAYAIALGAGTQALILIIPELLSSRPDVTTRGVLMGAAWVINLAVAEYVIHRRAQRSPQRAVLSVDMEPRMRPYAERVTGLLRSIWTAPGAVPAPPRHVWRDWALVALIVPLAVFEGLIRSGSPWWLLATITLVAVAPTVLWRRTRPLTMLAAAYIPITIVDLLTGSSVQLVTSALLLVLPYALFRWGTGRAMTLGSGILLADFALSTVPGTGIPDLVAHLVVILPIVSAALALRYRAADRMQQLDRVKSLEREQLARDLHDTVAHHVSAIAIRAQAGLATAEHNPAAATDALGLIEAEASRTLAEMRSMVRVLRRTESLDLAPSPRIADLEQLAGAAQGGLSVDVRITGDTDSVPPAVASAIYRIVQESITNARRHARHASRIEVRVDAADDGVHLSIRDDGETGSLAAPGYGITGMTERATLLGGTLQAGRAPGRGWVVTAVLPRAGWSA
jgi:signal transduction histidine kinase